MLQIYAKSSQTQNRSAECGNQIEPHLYKADSPQSRLFTRDIERAQTNVSGKRLDIFDGRVEIDFMTELATS